MSAALKVVTLHESNFRDPSATLRRIAEEIDSGDYGSVTCLALVVLGTKMELFTAGPDSDATSCALLFQAANLRLAKTIEEIGQD